MSASAPTPAARLLLDRLLARLLADGDWQRAEALLGLYGPGSSPAGGNTVPPDDLATVLQQRPGVYPRLAAWAGRAPAVKDEASSVPGFRVRLLGPPEVVLEPDHEVHWSLRRALLIFAYLAVAPERSATREELVSTFWEDAGEPEIRKNFHPTLSHLRSSLRGKSGRARAQPKGPAQPVPFRRGVYRLSEAAVWKVDAVRVGELAEEGRRARRQDRLTDAAEVWKQAWSLYRGPFLEGFYGSWVEETRGRLHRTYLALLADLGGALAQLGRAEEALDAYRAVLVEDPLEEPVHAAIMRLYAAGGRRDLVRLQYDRLTALLRRELGVEPLPQTTSEFQRLMA